MGRLCLIRRPHLGNGLLRHVFADPFRTDGHEVIPSGDAFPKEPFGSAFAVLLRGVTLQAYRAAFRRHLKRSIRYAYASPPPAGRYTETPFEKIFSLSPLQVERRM